LASSLRDETTLAKARRWLSTLIENGFPLSEQQDPVSEPDDGGLLVVRMETEVHVAVVDSIARAIRREEYLDFAIESSTWAHPIVGAVYQELSACHFTRSEQCSMDYFDAMTRLSNGSPLFGDDFKSQWSFYTFFTNAELQAIIPVFGAAIDFKRELPNFIPDDARGQYRTSLSSGSRDFLSDLTKWFKQIQQAKQDTFILWS
jgi:hypothetical protein